MVVAVRRRRAALHLVAAALSRAARAVARADIIYRQSRRVLAERDAIFTSAGLFRIRRQERAALQPPKVPRDAVVVVVALRRHAVLSHKKVVVVGELVHESNLDDGVSREFPLSISAVVVPA